MSWLDWLHTPAAQRLALTLLHFLWQGLLIAGGTAAVSSALGPRRAAARYRVFCAALALMAVCPFLTFFVLDGLPDRGAGASLDARWADPSADGSPLARPATSASAAMREPGTLSLAAVYPWIVLAWLTGACCCAIRLAAGFVGLRRLLADLAPIPGPVKLRVDALAGRLGVTRLRGVFASERVVEAMAAGFLRPLVLVPAPWLGQLPPVVLEAVIAHELAHIRRGDLWVNLLQRIVETLLFYHPAVWWVSRRLTAEREKCCDELAAAAIREPAGYAAALEAVARLATPEAGALLAAGLHGASPLLERVRYVLGLTPSREPLSWWLLPGLALVIALATVVPATRPVAAGVDPERGDLARRLAQLEVVLGELRSSIEDLVEDGTLRDVERELAGPSARVRADHWFDVGRYRLAAKGYHAALARDRGPRHRIELLERIREAHRRSGDLDAAIEAQAQVAEEIQPNDRYRALSTLAHLHKEAQRYEEAVLQAERAVGAATTVEERLSGLNFRAWYVELGRGAEAGLRAYEDAERLAVTMGMAESAATRRCREGIERLRKILAARGDASRGDASNAVATAE